MGRTKKKAKQSTAGVADDGDDRFLDLAKNPLFREMPRKEQRVKVDERFKKMLTDKAFQEDALRLDRRGRPMKRADQDNLKHIYEIDDEQEAKTKSSSVENDEEHGELSTSSSIDVDQSEEDEDAKDLKIEFDLARGQGNISSSSSDEDDGEDGGNRYEASAGTLDEEDNWGELDKGVRRVEWASARLAICNLDWTNVRAQDLMLLLNSLKPAEGSIDSISVYLSDFGAERVQAEKKHGPRLKLKTAHGADMDLEQLTRQAIHAHEMDKLRYYYAICVCDTVGTATAIYEACDGVEFESSGLRFDIRFVPDDAEFETDRIRDRVTAGEFNAENAVESRPKRVLTHALGISNPKMSWDAEDQDRKRKLKDAFSSVANLEQFDSLVACSSDDDVNEEVDQLDKAERPSDEEPVAEQPSDEEPVAEQVLNEEPVTGHQEMGGDRELSATESEEEEVVEVLRPKRKTKFQQYLERKKQLKHERKLKEQTARKQRRKQQSGIVEDDAMPQQDEALVAQIEEDARFTALFTDSAFAVDQSAAQYRGGGLAARQIRGKQRKKMKLGNTADKLEQIRPEMKSTPNAVEPAEDSNLLVERLKRKSAKHRGWSHDADD